MDVDVLDFIDAPLAENTNCRNTGPTLDLAEQALQLAVQLLFQVKHDNPGITPSTAMHATVSAPMTAFLTPDCQQRTIGSITPSKGGCRAQWCLGLPGKILLAGRILVATLES